MASVAEIAPLSTEFDVPNKRGTRGPDRGPRAPSGFKKAIEEIAQVIFSRTKISVEGAAAAVTPSIPKLIADISNDIREGSVEKFKISLSKLEKLIDSLGLDLKKYNKNLADFLKKRSDKIVKNEEKILDLRQRGAKVEVDQVSGDINILSREEIKQRTDTLKQTLISLEKTKKAKDKEEKILQKRSSLSEEEIETKKKNVQQSYENIKILEEQKQNLMNTLNIESEEDLPRTSFFDRFKRRGDGDQRGGIGEGIRDFTPNFIQEIVGSFADQIRGFMEPFVIMKDVVFDLLKPLKLLGKLFMPLIRGFGRLIKTIGLQIMAGMALVAVNLLRILTDKKVLIGLGALAALFGLKKLLTPDKEKEAKDAQEGKGKFQSLDEMSDEDFNTQFGGDNVPTISADESRKQRIINSGDPRLRNSANFDFVNNRYKSEEDRNVDVKTLLRPGEENLFKGNTIASNTNVNNSQTDMNSTVNNIVAPEVANNKNTWANTIDGS